VSRDTDLEDCFEIQEFGSRDSYIFKVGVLAYGSIDSQVGPRVLGHATSIHFKAGVLIFDTRNFKVYRNPNVLFLGTPVQYLQGRSSMGFPSWEFSCSGLIDSYNFNIEVFMFCSSDSCSFRVSKSPHDLVPRTPHLHLEVLMFWYQGLPQQLHLEVCNF
jgi:hypothetical protein